MNFFRYMCVVAALITFTSGASLGGVTALSIDSTNVSLGTPAADYVTHVFNIDFTGQLTSQELLVTLTSGSIFQETVLGVDTPPTSGGIGLLPDLEFDSFLAVGSLLATATTPSFAGGAVDIGGGTAKIFDSSGADVTWFPPAGTVISSGANFPIARITLSDDAQGTWRLLSKTGTGNGYISGTVPSVEDPNVDLGVGSDGVISNGQMLVPEPSSLLLLFIGLCTGLRLQARRASFEVHVSVA